MCMCDAGWCLQQECIAAKAEMCLLEASQPPQHIHNKTGAPHYWNKRRNSHQRSPLIILKRATRNLHGPCGQTQKQKEDYINILNWLAHAFVLEGGERKAQLNFRVNNFNMIMD